MSPLAGVPHELAVHRMNGPFAVAFGLFVLTTTVGAAVLLRWARVSVVVTVVVLLFFPFWSDVSDWVWFDWAKRYSVVVPIVVAMVVNAWPASRAGVLFARCLPFVFAVNVAEAALLEALAGHRLNAGVLVVLAVTLPRRFTWDERTRLLGFRDLLWQVVYTLALLRLFVTGSVFENSTLGAMAALIIPLLVGALRRDSHAYAEWRWTTLYLHILQDSFVPAWSDALYPAWATPAARANWLTPAQDRAWLAINVILAVALVLRSVQRRGTRCAPAEKPIAAPAAADAATK